MRSGTANEYCPPIGFVAVCIYYAIHKQLHTARVPELPGDKQVLPFAALHRLAGR
jgi:hypothetical protein